MFPTLFRPFSVLLIYLAVQSVNYERTLLMLLTKHHVLRIKLDIYVFILLFCIQMKPIKPKKYVIIMANVSLYDYINIFTSHVKINSIISIVILSII